MNSTNIIFYTLIFDDGGNTINQEFSTFSTLWTLYYIKYSDKLIP